MNFCVYRFIGKNREILYIGKADNLKHRLNGHTHLPDECYKRTKKIEYYSFDTKGDMELAEKYFISKYKPVYNDYLKYNISIEIKEFDDIVFETYVGRKKTRNNDTKKVNGIVRNLELYVKDNSFYNYKSKSGKQWYRVSYEFVQKEIESLSENGIYTEWKGCESTTKFGEEYEVPMWLVYSYDDNHHFYIYCEEKMMY